MVSLRKTLCCLLMVAGAATFVACGGDDEPAEGGGDKTGDTSAASAGSDDSGAAVGSAGAGDGAAPGLTLKFSPAYSYFIAGEGAPKFRVPLWVPDQDISGASWSVEPEGALALEPNNEFGPGGQVAEILQAGEITVTANLGETTATGKIFVEEATMEEYSLGEDRYNNMVFLELPSADDFMDADGGIMMVSDEQRQMFRDDITAMLGQDLSCINCHGPESTLGKEHGPGQVAGWDNDQLIAIMAMGMKPPGSTFALQFLAGFFSMLHTWEGDAATLKGLTVYVRALPVVNQDSAELVANLTAMFSGGSFGGAPPAAPMP